MRRRAVVLLRSARTDLAKIDDWLTEVASAEVAARHVDRILARIGSLADAGERGTIRNRPRNLRVIGLMKNISVAFSVKADTVHVHRVLYGGQDWQDALSADEED